MIHLKSIKKTFNNYFEKIYLVFIGFFWTTVYLYLRLVSIEQTPYDLNELSSIITIKNIFLQISFLVIHIILILYSLFQIFKNTSQSKSSVIIKKIQIILNILFTKPLTYIRELIGPRIPGSGLLFCKSMELIIKHDLNPSRMLVIIFYVLPRIVVSIIFFIEITIYHKIYYFIPSLLLLLVPILWTIIINIFTDFGKRALNDIPNYIQVIPIGNPLSNGWHEKYEFKEKQEYIYEKNDLKEYEDTWYICLKIYGYGEIFLKGFQQKCGPFVTLICSVLYFFAGCIKLYFSF